MVFKIISMSILYFENVRTMWPLIANTDPRMMTPILCQIILSYWMPVFECDLSHQFRVSPDQGCKQAAGETTQHDTTQNSIRTTTPWPACSCTYTQHSAHADDYAIENSAPQEDGVSPWELFCHANDAVNQAKCDNIRTACNVINVSSNCEPDELFSVGGNQPVTRHLLL